MPYTGRILLQSHRQYHTGLNSWLIASGDMARRKSMQRDMFRYIPDLDDAGTPDLEHQGIYMAGNVIQYTAPAMIPNLLLDSNGQAIVFPESHPRRRVLEEIDSAGTGPSTFEVPWTRVDGGSNLYSVQLNLNGPRFQLQSFTRPANADSTFLMLFTPDAVPEVNRMSRIQALESTVMGQNVSYIDKHGAIDARIVMTGNVFTGTRYRRHDINIAYVFFANSVHLDNLVDWVTRMATTMGFNFRREAHHRGLRSLVAIVSPNAAEFDTVLKRSNRDGKRPAYTGLIMELKLLMDAVLGEPILVDKTLPLPQFGELMDFALSDNYEGALVDMLTTYAPEVGMTRAKLVSHLVNAFIPDSKPRLRMRHMPKPPPKVHFMACATCNKPAELVPCASCGLASYCSATCRSVAWTQGTHRLYCIPPGRHFDGHFDTEYGRESLAYLAFAARWSELLLQAFGTTAPFELNQWDSDGQFHFRTAYTIVTDGRIVPDESFFILRDSFYEIDARESDAAANIPYTMLRQLWIHLPDSEKLLYLPNVSAPKTKRSPSEDSSTSSAPSSPSKRSQKRTKRQQARPRALEQAITLFARARARLPPELATLLADYTPASIPQLASHLKLLRKHRARHPESSTAIRIFDELLYDLFDIEVQNPLAKLVSQHLVWVASHPHTTFYDGAAKEALVTRMAAESAALTRLVEDAWDPDDLRANGAKLWRSYSERVGTAMATAMGPKTTENVRCVVRGDIFSENSSMLIQEADGSRRIQTPTDYPHTNLVGAVMNQLPAPRDLALVMVAFVALFPRAVLSLYPTQPTVFLQTDQSVYDYGTLIGGARTWLEVQMPSEEEFNDEPLRLRSVDDYVPKKQTPEFV